MYLFLLHHHSFVIFPVFYCYKTVDFLKSGSCHGSAYRDFGDLFFHSFLFRTEVFTERCDKADCGIMLDGVIAEVVFKNRKYSFLYFAATTSDFTKVEGWWLSFLFFSLLFSGICDIFKSKHISTHQI